MAKRPQDVIISEEDEALLKTALQLDPRRKIPQDIQELYGEIKITLGRLGQHTMTAEMLAMVPVLANRVARPAPRTFLDEIKDHGDVKYGTRVIAKFRNTWVAAKFSRLENGKVVVVLDDDTAEDRKIGVTNVRLATREDLKQLGEREEE